MGDYPFKLYLYNVHIECPPKIAEGVIINGLVGCENQVTIEKDVFTGHDVMILTACHDYYKFGRERINSANIGGEVYIEEGVWLASRCIIIGPCRIGKHSVIGAGSILVHTNVPAYQVWAGNPAKFIKEIPHENIS